MGSFRPIDDALFAELGEAQIRAGAGGQSGETGSSESLLGQIEQILGEDSVPDAAFFVDSWTVGVEVASENFRRRQEEFNSREREDDRTVFSLPPFFVASSEPYDEATWPVCEVSRNEDSPTNSLAAGDEEVDQPQFVDEVEICRPLTLESARRSLGVKATSTREQIRAAYRKLAIRYHPDRLVRGQACEQKLASDRMAYLNEAYRFLCTSIADQASRSYSR